MDAGGYTWDEHEFALLLLRKQYPERTQGESYVIRAYLLEHIHDFDRLTFSKRVGKGLTPDPTHRRPCNETRFSRRNYGSIFSAGAAGNRSSSK
jgi:hypothetical protein